MDKEFLSIEDFVIYDTTLQMECVRDGKLYNYGGNAYGRIIYYDTNGESVEEAKYFKPYLRPMEDINKHLIIDGKDTLIWYELLKEILPNNEWMVKEGSFYDFIPLSVIVERYSVKFENGRVYLSGTKGLVDSMYISVRNLLPIIRRYSLDYNDLISKGLAYDINNLIK